MENRTRKPSRITLECRSFSVTVLDNNRLLMELDDPEQDPGRPMTANETAAFLRRSQRWVYTYMRRKHDPLPFSQPGGRKGPLLFDRAEVEAWVERQ